MNKREYLPKTISLKSLDLCKYIQSELEKGKSLNDIKAEYKNDLLKLASDIKKISSRMNRLNRISYIHFEAKGLLDNEKKLKNKKSL